MSTPPVSPLAEAAEARSSAEGPSLAQRTGDVKEREMSSAALASSGAPEETTVQQVLTAPPPPPPPPVTTGSASADLDHLLATTKAFIRQHFFSVPPEHVGISFNGGKDSVAMMELLRGAIGLELLSRCCTFVFVDKDEFPEMIHFREEYVAKRLPGITLHCIDAPDGMRKGLWDIKARFPMDVAFMGTRKADPGGQYMKTAAEPTTSGWPEMLRVCPLFDWSYTDIWLYLLRYNIPVCPLYLKGFTSLGRKQVTSPNSRLRLEDGTYLPAWELRDGASMERDGRLESVPGAGSEEQSEGTSGQPVKSS